MPAKIPVQKLIDSNILVINDGYRAKNVELSKCGLPFARAQNINNGFHFDNADYFPVEDIIKVGIKVSRPGDVVFTSKGTVGRLAFVCKDTPKFVYAPQLCFWRSLNHQEIQPRWLYYWMHSSEFFAQYKGVSGQTDMAEYVSLYDQRNMSITVPSLNTQKRIAEILGSLDDKIELNRKQNETLEGMARAVFQSWFVDFDPVIDNAMAAGHPIPDELAERGARRKHHKNKPPLPQAIQSLFPDRFDPSPLGPIPKGWKVKSLDNIADFLNGLACQKYPPENDLDSLPVIKIRELRQGITDNTDRATSNVPEKYIIQDGDVLFSWSGSLLVKIWCEGYGVLNQHVFKVSSADYPKWFYYYWTHHHLEVFQGIAADKATTMGHIQRRHLSDAKTLIPDEKLLDKMSKTITPLLDKQIDSELESKTLTQLRSSLLPKLLTGEIEV